MSNETEQLTPKEVYNTVKEELKQLDQISPEEIEREMTERALEAAKDPMESAAMGFSLYSHKFKVGVDQLSARGAKRLLKALMDKDLSNKKYNLQGLERTLFEIGNFALECKFLMILNTYNEARDLLNKSADPNYVLTEDEQKSINILQGIQSEEE
jgi:hypothetical protein